jgi:hypothetical protein
VKTRSRVILSLVAVAVAGIVALMGTSAFIVLKNLSVTNPTKREAFAHMDALRHRFPERAPLIDGESPRVDTLRVNHPPRTAPVKQLEGFEILVWKEDDQEFVHTRAPLWMMRLSTMSILSEFGLAPRSLRLTVDDVERYGPGVVIDFTSPKGDRVLVVVQ